METGLTAARLTAQGLAGAPARDALAVVGRLLAVQAQDLRGARLAVRVRSAGLHAADVDRALTDDRSLVVTWLCRGTLHLVRREDLPWLHALTAPTLRTTIARRLAQEGVSPDAAERGVAVVERALAGDGPLGREALRGRLDAAGVPTRGQALVHVLALAALRGLVVRGPVGPDGEQRHALARDWLGPPPGPVDRDAALAELARRYLAGHAPATERDLAAWAGLPLRDARAGLRLIAGELAEPSADGRLALAQAPPPAALPPPRLLGPFDPVLHGWPDRGWIVGDRSDVVVAGGIFRPIALARGRAVATWSLPRGRVTLAPFAPLDPATHAALAADAEDVERFLGRGEDAASAGRGPA